MIITEIYGGLGNQMFQYAIARRLALIHGTKLEVDVSQFDTYKLRCYELEHFNLDVEFVDYNNIAIFKERNIFKKIFLSIKRQFQKKKIIEVIEKNPCFNESVSYLPDNVYLRGYWQSYKYFNDIRDIIINDFTLKEKLSEKSSEIAEMIVKSPMSVSMHIRRGDYVSDPVANSVLGICSKDYYNDCVAEIAKKFSDLQLFIFSDDIDWVKENLHFKYPMIFVNHNGTGQAYEDMHLMSLCKHNIIANSSFSWWGAWLNKNSSKMVFAPKQWFKKEEIVPKDIVPNDWIRK